MSKKHSGHPRPQMTVNYPDKSQPKKSLVYFYYLRELVMHYPESLVKIIAAIRCKAAKLLARLMTKQKHSPKSTFHTK